MLGNEVKEIISEYLKVLRENGIPVSYGVVFGSYVRGTAGPDSDIDLLVVSDFFDRDRRKHVGRIWRLAGDVDLRIEPIPVGKKAYKENDVSVILEIARTEGVKIS